MLICDTSGLTAYFDASDVHFERVSAVVDADPGPFIVSPCVLAELDYLLMTRRGLQAELAVLRELSGGAWQLPSLEAADLRRAHDIIDRYRDQGIGLADASLVVLADRFLCDRSPDARPPPFSRRAQRNRNAVHFAARCSLTAALFAPSGGLSE